MVRSAVMLQFISNGDVKTDEVEGFKDLIYFDVGTKNPKIIVHAFDFNLAKKTPNKTIWVCSNYYKTKCKCRVTTSGKMVFIRAEHNHLPRKPIPKFTNLLSQEVTIVKVPVRRFTR
ncbi:hypothetical protein WA026_007542 [Henosepilachna vigintioctopunctata]|uniref:FLYWCH-type domain-containing protein n=1 Tax=Henosepilachna vigintioctopunctata TaxID=420089 RepID=A0AAW1UM62_9CUCU